MIAKFYRDLFRHGDAIGEAALIGDGGRWSHVRIEIDRRPVRDLTFPAIPVDLRAWSDGATIQLVAIRGAHGGSDRLMYFDDDRERWIVTDVAAASPQAVACWHDGSRFWLFSQVDRHRFVRFTLDQVSVVSVDDELVGRVVAQSQPIPDAAEHGAAGIRQVLRDGTIVWNHSREGGRAYKAINGIRYLLPTLAGEIVVGSVNDRIEGVHLRTGDRFLVSETEGHDVRLVDVGGRYRCVSWMPGLGGFDVDLPPFRPLPATEPVDDPDDHTDDDNEPEPPMQGITDAQFATLERVRAKYPPHVTPDQIGAILNEVAWIHQDEGVGLERKASGTVAVQPWTGQTVWQGLRFNRGTTQQETGQDVLEAATAGVAKPYRGQVGPADPSKFIAPVNPETGDNDGDVDPPPPPPPPVDLTPIVDIVAELSSEVGALTRVVQSAREELARVRTGQEANAAELSRLRQAVEAIGTPDVGPPPSYAGSIDLGFLGRRSIRLDPVDE